MGDAATSANVTRLTATISAQNLSTSRKANRPARPTSRCLTLCPAPRVHVVHQRPAVPMGVRLLMGDIQSLALEIQVVDVGDPCPRRGALGCHALSSVPHGLLPELIRRLDIRLREGLVEVRIDSLVLIAAVIAPAVE